MNKQPSQISRALANKARTEPVSIEELIALIEIMADNFETAEAEAFRGIQAINEYYGVQVVNELLKKAKPLTGRG